MTEVCDVKLYDPRYNRKPSLFVICAVCFVLFHQRLVILSLEECV